MAATSRTETYDALLTTTARNMQPVLRDQITRSNKLIAWLEATGRMRRVNGGERIQVGLMYQLNSTADIYSGYGLLKNTPQDGITSAFYPWSQMAVATVISRKERRQNSGSSQLISLLQSKLDQSMASAKQLLNNCVVMGKIQSGASGSTNQFVARTGSLDNSADGPLPLPALVDADDDRSVAIGGINGANEAWWRNRIKASTASTYAGYKMEKNNIYNQCARGVGGAPDLILSDQAVWELYFNALEQKERYYITEQRIIDILGGATDEALAFRGAAQIWDEVVPDVGTSTATPPSDEGGNDGVGTYLQSGSHGTEYYLNTQAMEYIVDTETDWIQTPFVTPTNQDATISHMLWMGQVCLKARRKHGVMYDIDNSIAS